MRLMVWGALACIVFPGVLPAHAADFSAMGPLAGCVDPSVSPRTRAQTCKSLLASGTLTFEQTSAAWNGLAMVYYQVKDFESAIKIYSVMLSSDPKDFRTFLGRGTAYLSLGRNDLAIADYDSAVAIQPRSSYYFRAVAYYHLHQYDRAIADCDSQLQLSPNDARAKRLRDSASAKIGTNGPSNAGGNDTFQQDGVPQGKNL